jgi:cytochrome c556
MIRSIAPKAALLAAAAGLLASTLPALAASPQDIVAARKAGFKKMGGAFKTINDQIKRGAVDKPAAVAAAQTIAATARQQGGLFPPGTGPDKVKTDALPAIWTQKATFDAQMNKLVADSGKLVGAANSGDLATLTAQFKATGAVCAACHKQFRQDD